MSTEDLWFWLRDRERLRAINLDTRREAKRLLWADVDKRDAARQATPHS